MVDGGVVRRGADRETLRVIVLLKTGWHPERTGSSWCLDYLLLKAIRVLVVLRVGRRILRRGAGERIECFATMLAINSTGRCNLARHWGRALRRDDGTGRRIRVGHWFVSS